MNLIPNIQTNLYGLGNQFNELSNLYRNNKLPSKILFSGPKGIGKCTLSYHLINYILSIGEEYAYDLVKLVINRDNKAFKLIQNGSNPSFFLIDISSEKKIIDIVQIRNLINTLKKSSFSNKPRFVLIDNIEHLNLNSTNALLKILEEPPENVHFLLIHNNKKIPSTLTSRCLNFKINLSNKDVLDVSNKLLETDIYNLVNKDLIDYYFTPGKIYNLIKFSEENNLDIKNSDLKKFLYSLIDQSLYKKNIFIKSMIFDSIELFLANKAFLIYGGLSSYFLTKINNSKKFNLDDEALFLEIKEKILNG